jgi:hypothetical protein
MRAVAAIQVFPDRPQERANLPDWRPPGSGGETHATWNLLILRQVNGHSPTVARAATTEPQDPPAFIIHPGVQGLSLKTPPEEA